MILFLIIYFDLADVQLASAWEIFFLVVAVGNLVKIAETVHCRLNTLVWDKKTHLINPTQKILKDLIVICTIILLLNILTHHHNDRCNNYQKNFVWIL